MNRQLLARWGRRLSRRISLPKYHLAAHLSDFAKVVGPVGLVVDIGSGSLPPYRSLFSAQSYITLDYFEPADVRADASALPLASESANVAVATEVFEHLPDPVQALAEVKRVLVPKGYLLLTVPLIWGVHDYVDYQRWTERGLTLLLNRAGFEVLQIRPRGGVFSTSGLLVAQIPMQVFGEMAGQRQWWRVGAYMLIWAILAPIPWIGSLLDRFDHRKDYVVGYSVLSRRA